MKSRQQETSSGGQTSSSLPNINLERVAGYDVYDKNDEHVGKVTAIWADHTGQPAYLGVRTLWLIGKTHVVPAYGAQVNQQEQRIRLPYLKDHVKNAPNYDPDIELDFGKEQEVFSYYSSKGQPLPDLQPDRPTAAGTRDAGQTARTGEEARIALHEEQLKVGKRQVDTGAGVRLRKILRTETVNQPVELRREEIVVERVPAASDRKPGERAFEGQELYIPLRHEEPVVEKEVRVREEVQARKLASTEQQNVSGQVRREDIEVQRGPGQARTAPGQGGGVGKGQAGATVGTKARQPGGSTSSRGNKAVFGLARDEAHASRIVDRLKAAGFSNNDISVLLPDKRSTRDFAHEKSTKAPEGAVTGAATGGALGGALGWLAGVGALAIPGVGPFIAAGPIMAALSGAAVGAAAGGLVGTLVGMGIPEYEAKRYESRLREGGILVSVHSDNGDETRRAKEIFERDGAEDISSAGEESVSSHERRGA